MKNMKKAVACSLMAAMVGLGAQSLVAPEQVSAKADLDTYFDFEPHRGGRDARPENTLYSYAYAIEVGASSIECDMQLTADGNIVMSHNPVLNPDITRYKDSGKYIEAGKYDIRTMTVPELKKFDVGTMDAVTAPEHYYNGHGKTQVTPDCAELPTIDEFFQLVKDSGFKGNINIETKLYPDPDFPEYANNADAKKFVQVFYDKEMLVDMGCDGVITDKPWSTRPVLEAKGLKLRPRQAVAVQKYHLEPDHQLTETDKMANGTDAAY